ncbi:CobW family GTP-binding protein [Sporichthya polymorpha]|uniref:CobW family GTP-binding protein n=1 Tax=Sporichthya polymorpha TaxID=35751 RepID=UPI0003824724|nr:GTP-binding protein [Sporichthya polymorpha]
MVPLVVVSSIDPVMPQVLASGLLCDVPDLTVIRHEISAVEHRLRRVVTRADRVEEDVDVELEHTCLSCALRADIVPTVVRVAAQQPAAIALVLPVTADPVPAVHALARLRGDGVRVRATVAAVDAHRFEWDLLGNDLLAERDLAFTPEDRRSVGEALARQVESADVLALDGDLGRRASVLLDHLVGGEPRRVGLLDLQPADVLDPATPFSWIGRGDPARARPTGAAADCGIWTVDLQSWRPFHPHRLREQLERLGTGPLRARGYFWLPTRSGMRFVWDGVGGQLSVGDVGSWAGPPSTRLVITGTERDPDDLRDAFDTALMTETELVDGGDGWRDREDGWDEWLGR